MIKGLSKNRHGIADYTYVPLVLAAPELLSFTEEKATANLCYSVAGLVLGYSLLTDAPWGAVKWISYKTHAALDLGVGLATLAAPLVVKPVTQKARNTLLLMGLTGLVVGTLSLIGAKRT